MPSAIHVHECASLVELRRRERNAELDGSERQSSLDYRIAGVPRRHFSAPLPIAAGALQAIRDLVDDVIFDLLAVVGGVALTDAVEVGAPYVQRIQRQRASNLVHHLLDDHERLRTAEAAEGRIGNGVRLAPMRDHFHVLEEVRVIDVSQRATVDRCREVR